MERKHHGVKEVTDKDGNVKFEQVGDKGQIRTRGPDEPQRLSRRAREYETEQIQMTEQPENRAR